jgi:hypothetical protein
MRMEGTSGDGLTAESLSGVHEVLKVPVAGSVQSIVGEVVSVVLPLSIPATPPSSHCPLQNVPHISVSCWCKQENHWGDVSGQGHPGCSQVVPNLQGPF